MASLYDRISAGTLAVDEITASMERSTSAGGKYFQSMEKQSQTLIGQLSTLKDNVNNLLGDLTQGITDTLTNTLVPGAINAIEQMTQAFESGGFEGLAQTGIQIVSNIISGITSQIPAVVAKGYEILNNLATGFAQGVPEFLPKILDFIQGIGEKIAEYAPILIQKGFEILQKIAEGIVAAIPILIEKVPTIITTFANVINDNFPIILAKGAQIIGQLVLGLIQAIPTLIANVPKIVEAIGSVILAYQWGNLGKTIIGFFKDGILSMVGAVGKAGGSVLNAIKSALKNLPSTLSSIGKSAMNGLGNAIRGAIGTVRSAASSIGNSLISSLRTIPSKMLSIGRNIVRGLWNGISNMTGWIISKIGGFTNSVLNSIKSFFGIHSPSTVMRDEVGQWLAKGIGVGFEENLPTKQMTSSMSDAISKMKMGAMSITSKPVTTSSYQPGYYTKDTNNDIINEVAGLLLKIADRPIESNFYVGKEKMAKAIVKPLTEEQERKNKIINRLGGVR